MTPAIDAPRFVDREGSFAVDYRNHDGRIILGREEWEFETHWTTAGNGSVHVYRDGGSEVAVANNIASIAEVTPSTFNGADFTSRARTPREGEVVLFKNSNGYLGAAEIQSVRVTPDSQSGTTLQCRYKIFDKEAEGATNSSNSYLRLNSRANDAINDLDQLTSYDDEVESFGIGHNRPPPEAALSRTEYEELKRALHRVLIADRLPLTKKELSEIEDEVQLKSSIISGWCAKRFEQIQDGFFKQIGAAVAIVIGGTIGWATLTGKLAQVLHELGNLLR